VIILVIFIITKNSNVIIKSLLLKKIKVTMMFLQRVSFQLKEIWKLN